VAPRGPRAAAVEDDHGGRPASRLDRAGCAEASSGDERDAVFTSLPGVGVWTSAEARIRAFGDPDAVSVGDYHLAHQVGYALTGRRVDDDGMVELLEPWRGTAARAPADHAQRRFRAAPWPRLAPEDHRGR
jgi:3-methyladenine DNA glycosylase/8-oxoguanine DNA glycosylase